MKKLHAITRCMSAFFKSCSSLFYGITHGRILFVSEEVNKIFVCESSAEGFAFLYREDDIHKITLEYLLPEEEQQLEKGSSYLLKEPQPGKFVLIKQTPVVKMVA